MSLDVVFAHAGAREAMLLLMQAHPQAHRLLAPLVRYLGLFAPEKRELSFDRIARLLDELVPLIKAAQIERNGRSWPAPVDYWVQALEAMLAKRDHLQLPLKSHGYLLEVIAGLGNKAEAGAERKHSERMATGARDARPPAAVTSAGPVVLDATLPKGQMPAHVREQLRKLTGIKDRTDSTQGDSDAQSTNA
jgi:hypothetical protein